MSKKDFIALGDYLIDTIPYCEPFTDKQIEHLANFCHSRNSNFNRERFLGYVNGTNGPSGGKV